MNKDYMYVNENGDLKSNLVDLEGVISDDKSDDAQYELKKPKIKLGEKIKRSIYSIGGFIGVDLYERDLKKVISNNKKFIDYANEEIRLREKKLYGFETIPKPPKNRSNAISNDDFELKSNDDLYSILGDYNKQPIIIEKGLLHKKSEYLLELDINYAEHKRLSEEIIEISIKRDDASSIDKKISYERQIGLLSSEEEKIIENHNDVINNYEQNERDISSTVMEIRTLYDRKKYSDTVLKLTDNILKAHANQTKTESLINKYSEYCGNNSKKLDFFMGLKK